MQRRVLVAACSILVTVAVLLAGGPVDADEVRSDQWHLRALRIAEAHKISTGTGIVVGVVDTGVDPHPDLRRNLLVGTSVVEGENGDGRSDQKGHGTEMAGLIAAHGRSQTAGVLGIAPSAKILPVKESNATKNGTSISIAAGIEWAALNGAKVINVSSATGPSLAMKEAVGVASANDAIVVAGSGNKPDFLQFGYPAAMPGVLAVGATDRAGRHAEFSISGNQMGLCAPGVEIESTRPKGKYSVARGTSSSTAIVSGAAALVRAKFPTLTAQQVITRLTSTATDIGKPGRDNQCGYGLLNIVAALTAPAPQPSASPTPQMTSPTPDSPQAAPPDPDPTPANTALLTGGIIGALTVVGLLTFFLVRRRRSAQDRPGSA